MKPRSRKIKTRDLNAGFRTMLTEGQGVWRVALLLKPLMPGMIAAAMIDHDPVAEQLLVLLGQALREFPHADPAVICLLCSREFGGQNMPTAFVAVTAHIDDPSVGIINGLCQHCADLPELETLILHKYREEISPGIRMLPPFSPPSRA